MKDEEIRLSLKAVMMYERLSGKKFLEIAEAVDILQMMYCAFVCSTGSRIEWEVFIDMMGDKKFNNRMNREWKHIAGFIAEFNSNREKNSESGDTKEEQSISEVICQLIFHYGIDIDYVMNKMDIWEMETLLKGAEQETRMSMEDKRFWSYLSFLPNVDKKHASTFTPQKFLPFPWEKEKKLDEKTAKAALDFLNRYGKRRNDNSPQREGLGKNE